MLRDLIPAEPKRVIGFVEDRIGQYSSEGLSYAPAKLPVAAKARLHSLHRDQQVEKKDHGGLRDLVVARQKKEGAAARISSTAARATPIRQQRLSHRCSSLDLLQASRP